MPALYKMELPAVSLETATPDQKSALDKALAQVGFIPNMYAAMVNAPDLLETYLSGYAAFRKNSGFTPAEQEVVFLTISLENGCGYCKAAHSFLAAEKSGVPRPVIEALRNGTPVPDAKLAALSAFTRTMVESRGRPDKNAATAFLSAGFTEQHILEIVLALAVKTISNYANHLFHTEVDKVFAGWI